MANFSRKVVLVLLLFCLSPTYIGCTKNQNKKAKVTKSNQGSSNTPTVDPLIGSYSILAKVEDPLVPGSSCGAVWIGKKTLLTAASCFDQKGNLDLSQYKDANENTVRDMTITATLWGNTKEGVNGLIKDKKIKGKALIHPLFRRVDDTSKMPLAYDLAVVLADLGTFYKMVNAEVCSVDGYKKTKDWIAAVAEEKVKEWELKTDGKKPKELAIISTTANERSGEWYHIDERKQFTTYLDIQGAQKQKGMFYSRRYGAPIFEKKSRCVAGIISFAGQEDGKQYITSTKLVPVSKWIIQTQMFLDPEFAKQMALKEMEKVMDPFGPYKGLVQPGTIDIEGRILWQKSLGMSKRQVDQI